MEFDLHAFATCLNNQCHWVFPPEIIGDEMIGGQMNLSLFRFRFFKDTT